MNDRYRASWPGFGSGSALAFFLLLNWTATAHSQTLESAPTSPDSITFTVEVLAENPLSLLNQADQKTRLFRRGEVVRLVVVGRPRDGVNTYPITQRSSAQTELGLSKLTIHRLPGLRPLGPPKESDPEAVNVPNVGTILEYRKPFAWQQDLLVLPDATPGIYPLNFTIRQQVCSNTCLWEDRNFNVAFAVSDAPAVLLTKQLEARLTEQPPAIRVVEGVGGSEESHARQGTTAMLPTVSQASRAMLPNTSAQHRAELESVQPDAGTDLGLAVIDLDNCLPRPGITMRSSTGSNCLSGISLGPMIGMSRMLQPVSGQGVTHGRPFSQGLSDRPDG